MKTNIVVDISRSIPYDEVFFGGADKNRSFLQVDTIILGVHSKTCREYPINKLQYLCNISRKT